MSYIYATDINAVDASSAVNGTANPLVTSGMAGYIDALYGLLSDDTPGHTNLFLGLLQNADPDDPSTRAVLGMLLSMIGSSNFQTALLNECYLQQRLPAGQQCSQFMSLYNLLNTNVPSLGPASLLAFAQKYVADTKNGPSAAADTDITTIGTLLGTGSVLDQFIDNIGNNNTGYSSQQVAMYDKNRPQDLVDLTNDLNLLNKALHSNPPNYLKALLIIKNIENLANVDTDLKNDPNYLLAMSMLGSFSFNSDSADGTIPGADGQPMKDASGNVIHLYSLLDFANFDTSKLSAADQKAFATAVGICFAGPLNQGPDASSTWGDMLGSLLPAFITKW